MVEGRDDPGITISEPTRQRVRQTAQVLGYGSVLDRADAV